MPSDLSLLEIVKQINPQYHGIREQRVLNSNDAEIGWHSYVIDRANHVVAGGTAQDRETARRIAIAEFIERGLVTQLSRNRVQVKAFGLDWIPTTSGFAAGFDRDSTRFRSLCEGVERWAWSQWIDSGFHVPAWQSPALMTPLTSTMLSPFREVKFFQKGISVDSSVYDKPLVFSVLIGTTDIGAFAGSRVTTATDDPWSHAAIEAWRNHNNFDIKVRSGSSVSGADWLERRVHYFGRHQAEAFRQIAEATKKDWPTPVLHLSLGMTPYPGVHLWRTLFRDFVPWHEGPDDRFVY